MNRKKFNGLITNSATASERWRAMILGTNSPRIISSTVTIKNAMARAIPCMDTNALTNSTGSTSSNSGTINGTSAGSSSAPSPSVAIVIPACVAAI